MTTKDPKDSQDSGSAKSAKSAKSTKSASTTTRPKTAKELRSERRAREAKRARLQAEQEARDRKRQTIIGIIVVVIIVIALVAVIAVVEHNNSKKSAMQTTAEESAAYTALQNVKNKPSHATDEGGFVITKNYDYKKIDGATTFEDYFDALCPGCGQVHRKMDSELKKMMEAGQINWEIHPNGFLDQLSTDEYSTRAASAIAYVAQNDPEHVIDFIVGLYDENFQPSESNYQAVSDSAIQKVAKDAGVDEDVASQCTNGEYTEWIQALRVYTPQREITHNVAGSSKGSMTTPTMIINGYFWNLQELKSTDYDELFLQAIGLDSSKVGTSTMPSIGSTGVPLIGCDYLTSSSSDSSDSSGSSDSSTSSDSSASASSSDETSTATATASDSSSSN
ncbi:MAG: thioredoxin domain-containing protein [Bifidobacteriaceae bacterium]|nr:thioredoxin domain-containing protein [Bifidobacteriaceae bacterium]